MLPPAFVVPGGYGAGEWGYSPGGSYSMYGGKALPPPPPPMNGQTRVKHYLPSTSFAGGNNIP